jgi:hypothetical protein
MADAEQHMEEYLQERKLVELVGQFTHMAARL